MFVQEVILDRSSIWLDVVKLQAAIVIFLCDESHGCFQVEGHQLSKLMILQFVPLLVYGTYGDSDGFGSRDTHVKESRCLPFAI